MATITAGDATDEQSSLASLIDTAVLYFYINCRNGYAGSILANDKDDQGSTFSVNVLDILQFAPELGHHLCQNSSLSRFSDSDKMKSSKSDFRSLFTDVLAQCQTYWCMRESSQCPPHNSHGWQERDMKSIASGIRYSFSNFPIATYASYGSCDPAMAVPRRAKFSGIICGVFPRASAFVIRRKFECPIQCLGSTEKSSCWVPGSETSVVCDNCGGDMDEDTSSQRIAYVVWVLVRPFAENHSSSCGSQSSINAIPCRISTSTVIPSPGAPPSHISESLTVDVLVEDWLAKESVVSGKTMWSQYNVGERSHVDVENVMHADGSIPGSISGMNNAARPDLDKEDSAELLRSIGAVIGNRVNIEGEIHWEFNGDKKAHSLQSRAVLAGVRVIDVSQFSLGSSMQATTLLELQLQKLCSALPRTFSVAARDGPAFVQRQDRSLLETATSLLLISQALFGERIHWAPRSLGLLLPLLLSLGGTNLPFTSNKSSTVSLCVTAQYSPIKRLREMLAPAVRRFTGSGAQLPFLNAQEWKELFVASHKAAGNAQGNRELYNQVIPSRDLHDSSPSFHGGVSGLKVLSESEWVFAPCGSDLGIGAQVIAVSIEGDDTALSQHLADVSTFTSRAKSPDASHGDAKRRRLDAEEGVSRRSEWKDLAESMGSSVITVFDMQPVACSRTRSLRGRSISQRNKTVGPCLWIAIPDNGPEEDIEDVDMSMATGTSSATRNSAQLGDDVDTVISMCRNILGQYASNSMGEDDCERVDVQSIREARTDGSCCVGVAFGDAQVLHMLQSYYLLARRTCPASVSIETLYLLLHLSASVCVLCEVWKHTRAAPSRAANTNRARTALNALLFPGGSGNATNDSVRPSRSGRNVHDSPPAQGAARDPIAELPNVPRDKRSVDNARLSVGLSDSMIAIFLVDRMLHSCGGTSVLAPSGLSNHPLHEWLSERMQTSDHQVVSPPPALIGSRWSDVEKSARTLVGWLLGHESGPASDILFPCRV